MKKLLACVLAITAIAAVAFALPAMAAADGGSSASVAKKGGGKKNKKVFTVCKHGCKYKSIQKAVDKVKKKNSTVKIKPGKYSEGVIVQGHKYDGLTIEGTSKNAKKTILDGKNAKTPDGLAQNGIEGIDVKNLTMKNMWARNFATNGFFVRDSDPDNDPKIDCTDYLMKNLIASFNRSYGLYAYGCSGGRMTDSIGYGHGDSAFYVGGTPVQTNPKITEIDHDQAYENVLGYSGTNSKYMDIHDSDWYNNGVGLVPNTLDSEPFEPASNSEIHDNNIFWNNFNYYLPGSPVKTVSNGLGTVGTTTLNYPTGIGIVLFGVTNWKIDHNNIFGNFKWGSAAFSDPFNEHHNAISKNNQFLNNHNGRTGTDTNGTDFWVDGSGRGNCFAGNSSSTFDPGSTPASTLTLYPLCPAPPPPASGTGSDVGDATQQAELLQYVGSTPPDTMACSWKIHQHPAFEGFKPIDANQKQPNCN